MHVYIFQWSGSKLATKWFCINLLISCAVGTEYCWCYPLVDNESNWSSLVGTSNDNFSITNNRTWMSLLDQSCHFKHQLYKNKIISCGLCWTLAMIVRPLHCVMWIMAAGGRRFDRPCCVVDTHAIALYRSADRNGVTTVAAIRATLNSLRPDKATMRQWIMSFWPRL